MKKNGVREVELVGVDGGGCVALTAIGAANLGLKVTLNTAAIGTVFESKRKNYYKTLRELGAEFI